MLAKEKYGSLYGSLYGSIYGIHQTGQEPGMNRKLLDS
jgi:hypothetical protein